MKTHVLLAGLIALAPQVDPQGKIVGITALILKADEETLGHLGHTHEALLLVYGANGQTFQNPSNTTLTAGTGTVHIDDPNERILDFGRLLPKGESLREECISGDVQTKCLRPDGKPALIGRVTLKGAWTLRPMEIDYDYFPHPNEDDLSIFGFVSYAAPHVSSLGVSLAGGVLFETEESVALTVNGKAVPVSSIPDCSAYHLGGGACSYLRASNLPKSGLPAPRCGQRNGEVDSHFDLIYELFESKPTYRYLPFNRLEDVGACQRFLQRPGPGDYPPRIKCPTALLSSVAAK
jgi:hypothetical protein